MHLFLSASPSLPPSPLLVTFSFLSFLGPFSFFNVLAHTYTYTHTHTSILAFCGPREEMNEWMENSRHQNEKVASGSFFPLQLFSAFCMGGSDQKKKNRQKRGIRVPLFVSSGVERGKFFFRSVGILTSIFFPLLGAAAPLHLPPQPQPPAANVCFRLLFWFFEVTYYLFIVMKLFKKGPSLLKKGPRTRSNPRPPPDVPPEVTFFPPFFCLCVVHEVALQLPPFHPHSHPSPPRLRCARICLNVSFR